MNGDFDWNYWRTFMGKVVELHGQLVSIMSIAEPSSVCPRCMAKDCPEVSGKCLRRDGYITVRGCYRVN